MTRVSRPASDCQCRLAFAKCPSMAPCSPSSFTMSGRWVAVGDASGSDPADLTKGPKRIANELSRIASRRTVRSVTWLNFGVYMISLLDPLEAEASFAHGVADGGDVRGATCLKRHIDHCLAKTHTVVGAVVECFDDVGTLAGKDLGEMEQSAGAILQVDPDSKKSAILDQTALDDLGEQCDVDIAAAHQHHRAAMTQVCLGLDDRSKCGSTGAFRKRLFLLQKHQNGTCNFFVVDSDDLVHVAADQRKREVAGAAHSN